MSSLARMLSILDLFDDEVSSLDADEIIAALHYSRPTGYRYVRELVSAGLLVRTSGGYALGPRIIELDWHIRRFDPVLAASRPIVEALAARSGCSVTQMGIYGERIITVDHVSGPEPLAIGFGRGRPMPLFRGAPSRAIVAFMPRARQKRLYESHRDALPPEIRRLGFARFHNRMLSVRRAGYAVSIGELDPDKVGIAAPLRSRGQVSGSLCLVLTTTRYATSNQDLLAELIVDSTRCINDALIAASDRSG